MKESLSVSARSGRLPLSTAKTPLASVIPSRARGSLLTSLSASMWLQTASSTTPVYSPPLRADVTPTALLPSHVPTLRRLCSEGAQRHRRRNHRLLCLLDQQGLNTSRALLSLLTVNIRLGLGDNHEVDLRSFCLVDPGCVPAVSCPRWRQLPWSCSAFVSLVSLDGFRCLGLRQLVVLGPSPCYEGFRLRIMDPDSW